MLGKDVDHLIHPVEGDVFDAGIPAGHHDDALGFEEIGVEEKFVTLRHEHFVVEKFKDVLEGTKVEGDVQRFVTWKGLCADDDVRVPVWPCT